MTIRHTVFRMMADGITPPHPLPPAPPAWHTVSPDELLPLSADSTQDMLALLHTDTDRLAQGDMPIVIEIGPAPVVTITQYLDGMPDPALTFWVTQTAVYPVSYYAQVDEVRIEGIGRNEVSDPIVHADVLPGLVETMENELSQMVGMLQDLAIQESHQETDQGVS